MRKVKMSLHMSVQRLKFKKNFQTYKIFECKCIILDWNLPFLKLLSDSPASLLMISGP